MARTILEQVPRRGALTEAPRSSVGPETMASPWAQVANIAAGASGLVLDAAAAKAQTRGTNAVTRDEDGNLNVKLMSDFTEIGRSYNRAAMSSYLSRYSGDMRTAASEFTRQSNGNPEAFRAAWDGYAAGVLGRVPPQLRGGVEAMLEDVGGTSARGIADQRFNADMTEFQKSIEAERSRRQIDLLQLAARGGTNTPEFQRAVAEYRDLGLELAGNPGFTVSADAMAFADDRFMAELQIEYVTGEVGRRFASSPAEARQFAEEFLANPDLELTPEETRAAVNGIMQQFSSSTGEYALRRAAVKEQYDPLMTALRSTALPYDPAEVRAAITAFEGANDFASANEVRFLVRTREQVAAFPTDPAAQLAVFGEHTAAATGQITPATVAFLEERGPGLDWQGLNGTMGTAITAAAQAFEATHPGERATFASARRTTERQAQLYADFLLTTGQASSYTHNGVTYQGDPSNPVALAAPPGSSRHEIGTAVDINSGAFLDWLRAPGRAAVYGLEFLTDPNDPGHVQLSGAPVGGAQRVPPEVIQQEQAIMTADLRVMIGQYDTLVTGGTGFGEEEAGILVGFARAADDPALTARVSELITRAMTTAMVTPLNARAGEALLGELGNIDSPMGDAYVAAVMANQAEAIEKNKDELRGTNPAMLGQVQGLYELAPLPTDMDALPAALEQRNGQLMMLSQHEGVFYGNLLQPAEAAQMAEAWRTADADGRVAMMSAFVSAIDDTDVLNATLGQFMENGAEGLAISGALAGVNPVMAEAVVRGQQLLTIDGKWAPPMEDTDGVLGMNGYAAAHVPRSAFAGNGLLDGARQGLIEAARYAYVGLAAAAGLEPGAPISPELMEQAFDGVTGGMVNFNGQDVFAPVYGMTQEQFDRAWQRQVTVPTGALGTRLGTSPSPVEVALRGAQTSEGLPITWDDVWHESDVFLESTGDGRYAIRFGTGAGATYAVNAEGGVFELNMKAALVANVGMSMAQRMGVMPGGEARPTDSVWNVPPPAAITTAPPVAAPAPAPVESRPLAIDVAGIVGGMQQIGMPEFVQAATQARLGGVTAAAVMEGLPQFQMPEAWTMQLQEAAMTARAERNRIGAAQAARGVDVGAIVNGMPQFQLPLGDRIDAVLRSRERVMVEPSTPMFEEAVQIFERSPATSPDTLTRENFYAMMVTSGLPRGQLIQLLAQRWGTSVVLLNQRLRLEGL